MRAETQGWGDSMVATKYIYQRIHSILDLDNANAKINIILNTKYYLRILMLSI